MNPKLPPAAHGKQGWPWTDDPADVQSALASPTRWPRITIVTPSFNQGEFLEETIRSVLLQGYPNLDYHIVDGGSTDDSVEIIRKYAPWLSSWTSEPDRGQSDAINKGFRRASGEIMGWINSDDTLKPGALRKVATLIGDEQEPAWVIGASEIVDENGGHLGVRAPARPTRRRMLRWGDHWFPQQSTFWNRRMWEVAGPLREDLHYSMDHALWLEMIRWSDPLTTDEALSSYRFHDAAKCKTAGGASKSAEEKTRVWLGHMNGTPRRIAEEWQRTGWRGVGREAGFAASLALRLLGRKRSLMRLLRDGRGGRSRA